MIRAGTTQELAAPLSSVDVGHLVFTRGASHLTIGVDGSMEDLYRARFEGKVPDIRVDGGTVTVKYRMALHSPRGAIVLSGRVPWAIRAHMGMSHVVADLGDAEVRRASELPGWSVGHLLTHLARNAESMCRRIDAALRSEIVDQYEGGPAGRAA